MHTKTIGSIGEAKVLSKFLEYGYDVYLPFGENSRADMIIDIGGNLLKIQVKTSTRIINGCAAFKLVASTWHNNNGSSHVYTENEIDYFVLYSIPLDELYMIHVNESPDTCIYIRHSATKNLQKSKIRNSDDYQIDNVINIIAPQ